VHKRVFVYVILLFFIVYYVLLPSGVINGETMNSSILLRTAV